MPVKHFSGDCKNVLAREVKDNSVNLIVTSPPYAEMRKKQYGGIPHDEYVEWFLERSAEFKRVLHPRGTMVINIKENVVSGERSTYVLELIIALKEQGWLWTEEFIWHKKTGRPGKWPNRFRDAWERLLQFNLEKKFDMYQDEVKIPIGDWAIHRRAHPSKNDSIRRISRSGSGVDINVGNCVSSEDAYPDNVLHLSPNTTPQDYHSATFPEALPEWFIKLFTKEGDTVLDPFEGSGTTGMAAVKLRRSYIGVDIEEKYVILARERITNLPSQLDFV